MGGVDCKECSFSVDVVDTTCEIDEWLSDNLTPNKRKNIIFQQCKSSKYIQVCMY